jgi:hypothetical protein
MNGWLSRTSQANLGWAAIVLLLLLCIAVLSYWATHSDPPLSPSVDAKIAVLTRNAKEWSQASKTSLPHDPMIAVVQAAQAVAYLRAARLFSSDGDVERVSNERIENFRSELAASQQKALASVAALCPKLETPGITALNTGWLG